MIDKLIVNGAIGSPQPHHQTCLSTVGFTRHLQSKVKPTITYISSPITGAQIELKYWQQDVGGVLTAFVQLDIPLASATMGHNYAHAGLCSIREEMKCASLLIQVILAALQFSSDEIAKFRITSEVQMLELTWHTPTASNRARLNLQERTRGHFDGQQSISNRHDIGIRHVDYKSRNGKAGILATLKSGDQLRQYSKIDQLSSRTKADRKQARISAKVREHLPPLLREIEFHVRNEAIARVETLKQFGLEHPSSWSDDALKRIVDHVWEMTGLAPLCSSHTKSGISKKLSSEVERTWRWYLARQDMSQALSAHTFTRHRKTIKQVKGRDIAIPWVPRAPRADGLGKQLCYDRRWEPSGDMRKLVLCEETAPAIIKELKRGLAFLETGEVPDLDGELAREDWKARWVAFAERERGRLK